MPEQIAAPVVDQNASVDFDAFTQEELQSALANGDLSTLQAPAPAAEEEVPAEESVASTPPAADAAPVEPSAPEAVTETEEEESPAAAEPESAEPGEAAVPSFVFTPDSDDETFAKEREAFFEAYEVDENVQYLLDRDAKIIEALRAEKEAVASAIPAEVTELQTQTLEAMEQLVTRQKVVKDGHEVFVPNTQPMLQLLTENYPHEVSHLAEDFMGMASQKYRGMTLFQEYIKDYGGLDDHGMESLERFLETRGQVPMPSYVPRGIDPRYTEAYWRDPQRSALDESLEQAYTILSDEYQEPLVKEQARQTIFNINRRLDDIQFGIDSRKNQVLQEEQRAAQRDQQIQQAAKEAYVQDATILLRSFSEQLAQKLDMFDAAGAGVTATAYGTLILNALADDEWATGAQEDLKKYGVDFNWKQGRQVMDQFWDIQHELAEQAARKASPAETAVTQRRKANVIKEIKKLQLDALGKIGRIAIKGSGQTLKQKVAAAPKQQASRLKVPANETAPVAVTSGGLDQYDKMTPEEIRSRLGEIKNQMMGAGVGP